MSWGRDENYFNIDDRICLKISVAVIFGKRALHFLYVENVNDIEEEEEVGKEIRLVGKMTVVIIKKMS